MTEADPNPAATDAVLHLYFFLISDAYREYEKEDVRCECYSQAQFHFDDGVKFIVDASGEQFPLDHPLWRAYAEKIAEVEARVVRAEERKKERLGVLKGVRSGFERFCGEHAIGGGERLVELGLLPPATLPVLMRSAEVASDEETAEETQRLLNVVWQRLTSELKQPSQ
jgi:hypothetical protein